MRNAREPDYGLDAPELFRAFLALGVGLASLGSIMLGALWFGALPVWVFWAIIVTTFAATYCLGMAWLMHWSSRVAKIATRDKILDLIDWANVETALDIGCGRGLLLIGAAKRMKHGVACGIDLWLERDQAENGSEYTLANAVIEGVAERIRLHTGDARELSFADASFDLVTSHWVIHNIPERMERKRALSEMRRVLKPGGVLILTDIEHRAAYLDELDTLGFEQIRLHIFNPWLDKIYGIVSFGSFQPATIIAKRAT